MKTAKKMRRKRGNLVQRSRHVVLQLKQPLLHLAPGFRRGDGVQQLHHLPFTARHVGDVQHVSEDHARDALKALLQVGLHPGDQQRQS